MPNSTGTFVSDLTLYLIGFPVLQYFLSKMKASLVQSMSLSKKGKYEKIQEHNFLALLIGLAFLFLFFTFFTIQWNEK